MGILFVYGCLVFVCCSAIVRPWIGVVGYFGFAVWIPTWLWRWSGISQDANFQKFIVVSTLIGMLANGLKGSRFKGAPAVAFGCLAAYLIWAFVTAQFTINERDTTFFMENIWKIVLMSGLGLFLIDSPPKVKTLMWTIVLAQGWNAYEINLQYFQDGYCWAARGGWGFLDNNTYSILTVPVMGLSLALAFYSEKTWQRLIAGSIFVLQLHELMLLESRGTMLGGIGLAMLGVWFVHKNTWTVSTIVAATVAGCFLAGPPVVKEMASAFKPKEELDSSAESRFKLWKAGVAITKDHPVTGVGPNAGRRLVPRYYEGGLSSSNKALHNLFFDISCGSGIPGALFYFLFWGIVWMTAFLHWRHSRNVLEPWANAALFSVLCGTPGYMLSSMFSSGALIESSYICCIVGGSAIFVLRNHVPLQNSNYVIYTLANPQSPPPTSQFDQPHPFHYPN